ncbi:cytochrome P450 [Trifolium medium]|uniref:Cytochrome P450 n=1 Tax=Trifolium medium TaxID=97028 RepID=A0A392MTH9_9FABA|nr:cytochrome P450 [Trifolium medium]
MRMRLNDHGVQCLVHCAVCNNAVEDSLHVLFLCPRSLQSWQRAGLWEHVSAGLNVNSNIAENINESDQTVCERARHLITCWQNAQVVHSLAHSRVVEGQIIAECCSSISVCLLDHLTC